jgi:hypothetical protein
MIPTRTVQQPDLAREGVCVYPARGRGRVRLCYSPEAVLGTCQVKQIGTLQVGVAMWPRRRPGING